MWFIRSLIILVGVIAFLWVGMNNADQRVDFEFFTKSFMSVSLNLLLLLVFGAGMVFSFLIAAVNEFQLRTQLGSQKRTISGLTKELGDLRSLPLDDASPTGDSSVEEI